MAASYPGRRLAASDESQNRRFTAKLKLGETKIAAFFEARSSWAFCTVENPVVPMTAALRASAAAAATLTDASGVEKSTTASALDRASARPSGVSDGAPCESASRR